MSEHVDAFRPGLYRHYKGGFYTAIALVTHHERNEPMVLYVSHTYGGLRVRPLVGWPGDVDGWATHVVHEGMRVPRFEYIGALPSNTPIEER